jgi:hypothetical protein
VIVIPFWVIEPRPIRTEQVCQKAAVCTRNNMSGDSLDYSVARQSSDGPRKLWCRQREAVPGSAIEAIADAQPVCSSAMRKKTHGLAAETYVRVCAEE